MAIKIECVCIDVGAQQIEFDLILFSYGNERRRKIEYVLNALIHLTFLLYSWTTTFH